MGCTVTMRRHSGWSLAVTLLLLLHDVHRPSHHGASTMVRADTVRVVPAASLYPNDEAEISTTTTTSTSLDSKQNPKETTTTTTRSDDLQRQWSRWLRDLNIMSLRLVLHPNGNASCRRGMVITVDDPVDTDTPVASSSSSSSSFDHQDKYQMEAALTEYMATVMMRMMMDPNDDDDDCWRSPRNTNHGDGNETSTGNTFYDYCDTGTKYTVIQHDHPQLIRVGNHNTLPCRFYTREGVRMASIPHLQVILQNVYHQHHNRDVNKITTAGDNDEGCFDATTESTTTATTVDMDGTTFSSSSSSSSSTESPPIQCRSTKRNPSHTNDATPTSNTTLELHLFAVPAGRVFHFAPSHIGEIFTLSHVVLPKPPTTSATAAETDQHHATITTSAPKNISVVSLEVLSVVPPIFDIHHFFSIHESEQLITKALTEQSETYRFHRSTTGTSGANVYSKRTSENAWDTHGATAQLIKRRCFQLLGFDEYQEEMTDGLQILRYNSSTAYISHLDYLEDRALQEPYDYDTSKKGGNRFATILLYFTTLDEGDGGETVFPRVYPPGVKKEEGYKETLSQADSLRQLRESGDTKDVLKRGSWEEQMTVLCRTRFSIRPKALRAVLFYSQFANGTVDPLSYHGGCPVLRGTKLAANLWTWSAIRPEFDGGPIRDGAVIENDAEDDDSETEVSSTSSSSSPSVHVTFENSGNDERFRNAELYYDEAGFFGGLGFDDKPISVNTYPGHVWNIKDKATKVVLQTFIIADNAGEDQVFEI